MLKRTLLPLLVGGPGGANWPAEIGLLVLRVTSGLFLAIGHGWPKVTNPSGFIDNAVRGNFPAPDVSGWFAILGEFLGGILLALGLFTRPAALWLCGVLAGAAFITHGDSFTGIAPFFMPAQGSVEGALIYLAIGVAFLFTGSGRTGVDRLLRK